MPICPSLVAAFFSVLGAVEIGDERAIIRGMDGEIIASKGGHNRRWILDTLAIETELGGRLDGTDKKQLRDLCESLRRTPSLRAINGVI